MPTTTFYLEGEDERDTEKNRDPLCFFPLLPFEQFAISGVLSIMSERKPSAYLVSCILSLSLRR